MKYPVTLDDLSTIIFNNDEKLLHLLFEAEQIDDALFYIANFSTRKFEYISPSCLEKTKYPSAFFHKGGADALYHLAEAETKLSLVEKQAAYLTDLKRNFAPEEAKILEFPGFLKDGGGSVSEFLCLSLILTYTADRDVDLAVILLMLRNVHEPSSVEHCKQVLKKIKQRHNAFFDHKPKLVNAKPLTVIHVSSSRTDLLLSNREEQTLKYIAQGLTTKEIGSAMNITENTVETYRKKLLEKFESKNIAELIKKASKVYWLE